MEIKEYVPLRDYTTFKLGGPARFFIVVRTIEALKEAFRFAEEKKLPVFILGGGSNVLSGDEGFPGVVIKIELRGISWSDKGDTVEVEAAAGELWDTLVSLSVDRNLFGLENLSGIPGSVGAAPVQNIGAYGGEVRHTILSVTVYDHITHTMKTLSNEECHFGYRDSIFKTEEGKRYVITAVTFRLQKKGTLLLSYKDLHKYFEGREEGSTLSDVREAVLKIRAGKFPDLREIGTAGSFFKNPFVTKEAFESLQVKFEGIVGFPSSDGRVKVSLAWILDKVLGQKGERVGTVGLYEKQPLVLVHFGNGTTEEVLALAEDITCRVKKETGIAIEPEVQTLGMS